VNKDEKIAKSYLKNLGFQRLEFEPNGNIPPDFSLNDKIGIEVRRLNKYFNGESLEKIEFGEIRKIENFILKFKSNKTFEKTHSVSIYYSRPLKFKQIEKKIENSLNHYTENLNENFEYNITENFTMSIVEYSERFESDFEVMIWVDHNKGGVVINDLKSNITLALKEKEEKIAEYFTEFEEWWLILINHISPNIRNQELEVLKQEVPKSNLFKKIIILDLNNMNEKIINCS
jgi:hypothetical protein